MGYLIINRGKVGYPPEAAVCPQCKAIAKKPSQAYKQYNLKDRENPLFRCQNCGCLWQWKPEQKSAYDCPFEGKCQHEKVKTA